MTGPPGPVITVMENSGSGSGSGGDVEVTTVAVPLKEFPSLRLAVTV